MADRMADWAVTNWKVDTEADLDRYTFGVAGAVGLLLSDLWAWYDRTDEPCPYYRVWAGLAVNILRNHTEDIARGVNYFQMAGAREDVDVACASHQRLPTLHKRSPLGPATFAKFRLPWPTLHLMP